MAGVAGPTAAQRSGHTEAERRPEPDQERRDCGRGEREDEHARVGRVGRGQGEQIRGRQHNEGAPGYGLHGQGAQHRQSRDECGLDQRLTRQTQPRSAERGANAEFVLAAHGRRQQQIRDVGAGHDQYERDCCLQEEQQRSLSRSEHAPPLEDGRAEMRGIGRGILGAQALHDRIEVCAGLRDGRFRPQPADDAQEPRIAQRSAGVGFHGKGRDELRIANRCDEAGRQHTDNHIGVTVEQHRRPNHVGSAAEAPDPQAVREHDDPRPGAGLVFGHQHAAERR